MTPRLVLLQYEATMGYRPLARRGGAIFLVFCAPILLIGQVGCRPADEAEAETQSGQEPTITIRLWTQDKWLGVTGREIDALSPDDPRRAKYTYTDWYIKTFKEFQKLHPEVDLKFEIETLDWTQTGFQKLDIAVISGHPPDVMISTSATTLKYARYDMLEPLDAYLTDHDREDFGEFLTLSEVDGKHYFLPFIGGNRYIACNLKIFRERNALDLLPGKGNPHDRTDRLWTWDQFVRAARATTFARPNGEQVFGYAMPFQRSSPMLEQGPFFWGFGGFFFDQPGGQVIVNQPGGVRGMQFMTDLEHKFRAIPPGSAGLRANDVNDLWNAGRLAMRQGAHSTKLVTERAIRDGLIKPGTIELYPVMYPSVPGIRPGTFVVADSPCVFKQKDPLKKKLVIAFVKFMTDTRHLREVAHALSTLPTRRSAQGVWADDPYQQYVLRVTKYGLKDAIQAYGYALREMMNYAMQAALSGQRTPVQALDEYAERGNRFIAREDRRRARVARARATR